MSIPSLPTDNLYKFIAVFGLILTLYSGYLYFQTFRDRTQSSDIVISEGRQLNKEYEMYLDVLQAKLDSQEVLQKSIRDTVGLSEAQYKNLIKHSGEKLRALEKWINGQQNRIQELSSSFESKSNNYDENDFQYYFTIIILSAFLIGGIYLVKYGFENWYEKHQKYIDAEMKYRGMEFIEKLKEMEQKEKANKERTIS